MNECMYVSHACARVYVNNCCLYAYTHAHACIHTQVYVGCKRAFSARRVLDDMANQNIRPQSETYLTIVEGLAAEAHIEVCLYRGVYIESIQRCVLRRI